MRTGSWDRCAARAATAPLISVLALFSVIALVSCVVIMLGPIAHVKANSRCYSAVPPKTCARTLAETSWIQCAKTLRKPHDTVLPSLCVVAEAQMLQKGKAAGVGASSASQAACQ